MPSYICNEISTDAMYVQIAWMHWLHTPFPFVTLRKRCADVCHAPVIVLASPNLKTTASLAGDSRFVFWCLFKICSGISYSMRWIIGQRHCIP